MQRQNNCLIASAVLLNLLAWSVMKQNSGRAFGSSLLFPVVGNVYPNGNYTVTINMGDPPLPYTLDIDTGSDLTWVQCAAPCQNCYPGPHPPYPPNKETSIVSCIHPICLSIQLGTGGNPSCRRGRRSCDYVVTYFDAFKSVGVLVNDTVTLKFTNGTVITPKLAFGCAYLQKYDPNNPPWNDGILGLGKGESGFITQLRSLGVTRNVVGHCLSRDGGGFILFGDDIIPTSDVVWTPILVDSRHYSLGSADVIYDGEPSDIRGLQIVFDSGSTYTYLPDVAYAALLDFITRNLDKKRLQIINDPNLPVCWTGNQGGFKTIDDIVAGSYFKTWSLSFGPDVIFQMEEQNFLIVTNLGNVCLGILNGGDVGLGEMCVIGDISMQDKLVIYDNELHQVGWAQYHDCATVPTSNELIIERKIN